jgi:hypothetical protein
MEYFVSFDTKSVVGKIVAVRVRIDTVLIEATSVKELSIDLCDNALYPDLVRYVDSNKSGVPNSKGKA